MEATDRYLKASRYDLQAQAHNRGLFHRWMLRRPGVALLFGIGMGALGAAAGFNWVEAPRWLDHPWMGWILAVIAWLPAGYIFWCAIVGWRIPNASRSVFL